MESKLKIEYTPYSALLYQEDEFGLEFLCPGYWLEKDILLIRGDCWPKDVTSILGPAGHCLSNVPEDCAARTISA
uniref:Uncharacterized protein n=1 Tax=Anopheles minimus TaxID=112268 RepID=A0A182W6B7_9DIPT